MRHPIIYPYKIQLLQVAMLWVIAGSCQWADHTTGDPIAYTLVFAIGALFPTKIGCPSLTTMPLAKDEYPISESGVKNIFQNFLYINIIDY